MTGDGESRGWARDARRFVGDRNTAPRTADADARDGIAPATARQDFGVTWRPFDVSTIRPSGPERARHRFRALLPELI